ncbi:hypothetical protein [Shimia abyssi]|uniref:Uncharacterized protein n=1 Tax=Shimia abyssi TaxID=1662395 RepID=A0A2P8FAC2_9RHOB|nr:hypothetical protein [Shimia abyssi]PSL18666.1 hypothetical protein CLV88_10951 [Shimia abyssi]
MTLILAISVFAIVLGGILPLRWGVIGFLAAVLTLFLCQFGWNTASGFEGSSWDESLLLFNGSVVSFLGFNLQITARGFVLPLLLISTLTVLRFSRKGK